MTFAVINTGKPYYIDCDVSFIVHGKYRPATLHEPEEYPTAEVVSCDPFSLEEDWEYDEELYRYIRIQQHWIDCERELDRMLREGSMALSSGQWDTDDAVDYVDD